MISTSKLTMSFGGAPLFENVSLKFLPGECYGLIGSNGAGKSTFLKLLSGELDSTSGEVVIGDTKRISVLRQDHFKFDDYPVIETVLMGDSRLYPIYKRRMELYAKTDLTNAEGEEIGMLEESFSDLDGYVAESNASTMLDELGISHDLQEKPMSALDSGEKVRVLLAQALFGNPDVLLLDEPTNQLDYLSVLWLEKFIASFKNTVIVVSHDRHFLNNVCTYIADVDFGEIRLYPGNYDFWKNASELALKQQQDKNKKNENKIKELEDFVRRFSANASKSKQATSRKKMIEKLRPEELPVSRRRSPYIQFDTLRSCGTKILDVDSVSYTVDGVPLLSEINFSVNPGDKIAIIGKNSVSRTALLDIISGVVSPTSGQFEWGETITSSYFPKDNSRFFQKEDILIEWLGQFQSTNDSEQLRGLLGRMLFSGENVNKNVSVLSGGEKARAMFCKMMLEKANAIVLDEPTDHLDLESISSLNHALETFSQCLIFTSHDYQILNTVPNRIIEVGPNGMIDRYMLFDDFMKSEKIASLRQHLYQTLTPSA